MRGVLAAIAFWMALSGAAPACELRPRLSQVAVKVLDGGTVLLDDGRTLRLAGLLAPQDPSADALTSPAAASAPAAAAREALEKLVLGRRLELALPGPKADRYGRIPARAFIADGTARIWVELELVRQGRVRVSPSQESRGCSLELLAAEAGARAAALGLWAEASYAVLDGSQPDKLEQHRLSFAIVEGRVHRVSASKSSIFIEFGRRWREDFTVLIRGRERALFAKAGIDLALLAGKRIRVRGYLESMNGPLLRITVPEQLELVD